MLNGNGHKAIQVKVPHQGFSVQLTGKGGSLACEWQEGDLVTHNVYLDFYDPFHEICDEVQLCWVALF